MPRALKGRATHVSIDEKGLQETKERSRIDLWLMSGSLQHKTKTEVRK